MIHRLANSIDSIPDNESKYLMSFLFLFLHYLLILLLWVAPNICYLLAQIPEEEKNLGPHDRLIHVYHFMKDMAHNQVNRVCFLSMFMDYSLFTYCFHSYCLLLHMKW